MRTKNQTTPPHTKNGTTRALTLARLPATQLRRLVTPHSGYEAFVDLFVRLVAEHGDELGTGIDVDGMLESLGNVQSLQPARDRALAQLAADEEQLALVSDTQLVESVNAWKQMLIIYGRAQQAARTSPAIEVALEPFARFMKTGPRKKSTPAT